MKRVEPEAGFAPNEANKRAKIVPSTSKPIVEDDNETYIEPKHLRHQYRAMYLRVREKARDIAQMRKNITTLEYQSKHAKAQMLVINRYWESLDHDLAQIASRSLGKKDISSLSSSSSSKDREVKVISNTKTLLEGLERLKDNKYTNLFLNLFFLHEEQSKTDMMFDEDDLAGLELSLQKRSEFTKDIIKWLCLQLNNNDEQYVTLAEKLSENPNNKEALSILTNKLNENMLKIDAEIKELRDTSMQQVNDLAVSNESLILAQERVKELDQALYLNEQNLIIARRRFDRLQMNQQAANTNDKNNSNTSSSSPSSISGTDNITKTSVVDNKDMKTSEDGGTITINTEKYNELINSKEKYSVVSKKRKQELVTAYESRDEIQNKLNESEKKVQEMALKMKFPVIQEKYLLSQKENEEKSNVIRKLKAKLTIMQEDLDKAIKKILDDYNDIESKYKSEKDTLLLEIKQLQDDVKNAREENVTLRVQVEGYKSSSSSSSNNKNNDNNDTIDDKLRLLQEVKSLRILKNSDENKYYFCRQYQLQKHTNDILQCSINNLQKKENLSDDTITISNLTSEIAKLKEQLASYEEKFNDKTDINELREQLDTEKEMTIGLMSELDEMASALEELEAQNIRLCEHQKSFEKSANGMLADRLRNGHLQKSLQEGKRTIQAMYDAQENRVKVQETMIKALEKGNEEKKKLYDDVTNEYNKLNIINDNMIMKEQQTQAELNALKKQYQGLEEQLKSSQDNEIQIQKKIQKSKQESNKLQEKIATLQKRVEREGNRHSGDSYIQGLETELSNYKSKIQCKVCSNRDKNAIITKCFHMFCSECIQHNLDVRLRKCPGCKVPFGKNDVKQVYLSN